MADITNPETSQFTVSIQYAAYLGSGQSDHLKFLYEPLGHTTYLEFITKDPEIARLARVSFYTAETSLDRRSKDFLNKTPEQINPCGRQSGAA